MSTPEVGDDVLYYIKGLPQGSAIVSNPDEWAGPFAAKITAVRSEDRVNLTVHGETGNVYSMLWVKYFSDPDISHPTDNTDRYCVRRKTHT